MGGRAVGWGGDGGGGGDAHQRCWRVRGVVWGMMQTVPAAGVVAAAVGEILHAAEAAL